jgi:excisionase family DNA binding protein
MGDPPKEFLDTRELADWLGVPEYTVTREAREGRLPARKVGRGWRFSRTAILEHFRGSDATPSPLGDDLPEPPTPD